MKEAFDWMSAAGPEKRDLARQSLGRVLTEAERDFATALEAAFASGLSDFDDVAGALNVKGAVAPSDGATEWSAERLQRELQALNADLDLAYAEGGYGA